MLPGDEEKSAALLMSFSESGAQIRNPDILQSRRKQDYLLMYNNFETQAITVLGQTLFNEMPFS